MSERIQYKVRYPGSLTGTEIDGSSPIVDLEEAHSYQAFIESRGGRTERLRRTVTYGEWEVDSD